MLLPSILLQLWYGSAGAGISAPC